ncbi:MAG TPA: alpha/beta fold hydrolase [Candidatus Limnocylindrales bacterium]|jgi:pimeloyl-ACP methyl ester carboxylesterase
MTDRRQTIVFLHATRLSGAQWRAQADALGEEFRCVLVDLPGHGAAAGRPFTLEGAASEVATTIAGLPDGRAVLVGLSLGGYVAMEVAARWPERVAGLVIAGATVDPVGLVGVPFRTLAIAYRRVPATWLARSQTWTFRRRYRAELVDPIVEGGWWFRGGSAAVSALIGHRFRPSLARYGGPILLVNGQRDLLFRVGERAFAATGGDVRRVLIRGAGHRSNLDQPEAFTAVVGRFARSLPPAGESAAGR